MTRYPLFSFVFFIIFIAISLYQVKYFILKREVELAKINKDIMLTKSDINILRAELNYLKRPDRIEKIAIEKLNMRPVLPIDIWNIEDLFSTQTIIKNGELL
jgi:cell division protein FtsL